MALRATGYPHRGENKGIYSKDASVRRMSTNVSQGFDEFMNLVIDDAVEVKQATKIDEEKRRELGIVSHSELLINHR